ncbi:hypothetical protein AB1N83_001015 [Pleurotus pulmonarius]
MPTNFPTVSARSHRIRATPRTVARGRIYVYTDSIAMTSRRPMIIVRIFHVRFLDSEFTHATIIILDLRYWSSRHCNVWGKEVVPYI